MVSFFKFIAVYLSYKDEITNVDEDNIVRIIIEIKRKFDKIDIQALRNEKIGGQFY